MSYRNNKGTDQPAHLYVQSDQRLCCSFPRKYNPYTSIAAGELNKHIRFRSDPSISNVFVSICSVCRNKYVCLNQSLYLLNPKFQDRS